ncbi:hypothetical protein OF83DRAFT_1179590 [Amylostereum chailletii]|nr:hypothetical protein OF83DRAFT_1179590 [Amylostereum chailletii]
MSKRARPSPSASDDEDPLPSPSPSHRQKKSKLRRSHFDVKEASLPVNKPPTRVTRTPSLQESSQEVRKSGLSKKTHKSTKKPPTDVSGSPSPKLNLTVCQKTVLGKLGRAVIRSVGFHLDLDKIFQVGITRDRSKSKSRMTDKETVMYTLYCKILALSPLLTFFVKNKKSSLLEISLRKVMDASSGARSADSNKLKEAVPR